MTRRVVNNYWISGGISMANTPKDKEPTPEKEHSPMFEGVRRVLLAGIGVVALTMDEVEEFVDKMVERGELAEKDGKKIVHEVMEKRKKEAEEAQKKVNKRVWEVLDRMDISTHSDIEALSKAVEELSKKVDEMMKPRE
jgi:poly(hydroxyalkanoate) granule-associated protein